MVVDLGCGSGYFTLKLSSPVGDSGRVIAEDIRRLPLMFLWLRTVRDENTMSDRRRRSNDPHLPDGVNAVLIANTYHEFTDPRPILAHVYAIAGSGGTIGGGRSRAEAGGRLRFGNGRTRNFGRSSGKRASSSEF